MINKNYFLAVSNLINELISNDYITFLKYNIKSGYPDHYILQLENNNNITIDNSIKFFYQNIGSLEIQWNYIKGDENLFGEINIIDLNQFLNLNNDQDYWIRRFNESNDPEQNEFTKSCKPFDYFNSDEIEIAFFLNSNNIINDELYYFKSGFGHSKLNLSINEYFDKLIETKGLVGWQKNLLIGKFEESISIIKSIFN
ncbi:hypothetical protein [Aquimarina sp. Aq107]|uniref:hypothetical protein n=1 Tax=Aquimarina sp. Aq107 TaxID=1191912 RepID=UPI000D550263|nr:hypothetical protein [Aquimarina sp. Aq107]